MISGYPVYAQGPTFDWVVTSGAAGSSAQGYGIAHDAVGNVYVTGRLTGTVDFDPGAGSANLTSAGALDTYITKMDADGNLVWARRVGGTLDDYSFGISVDDAGNVHVVGAFVGTADFDPGPGSVTLSSAGLSEDIFVLKLDANGNFVWARKMGSSDFDFGRSIVVSASGNVITTGSFRGTVDFDPGSGTSFLTSTGGGNDIFVSKLNAAGNFVWAKRLGGTGNDIGYAITVDAAENVFTTGSFRSTADFDPGPAVFNLTDAGNGDTFVSKLDASGNFVWARHMGGTGSETGHGIQVDYAGNVYTTGDFHVTADFDPGAGTANLISAGFNDAFISKLDPSGNYLWAKSIGGAIDDDSRSLAVDGFGNVYAAGSFESTVDFDPGPGTFPITSAGSSDGFVVKLNSSGDFVWAQAFLGTGDATPEGIDVVAFSSIYTTGGLGGSVDFDIGAGVFNVTSTGPNDHFTHKMRQAGTPPTITSFAPANGPVGTTVTISGTNFSLNPTHNIVYFGATRAVVTVATLTQLTVTVPIGATYESIRVMVYGLSGASASPFVVTFPDGGVVVACSFAPKVDFIAGTQPYGQALGDLDGDGKADLVVANYGTSTFSVFRNIGSPGPVSSGLFAAPLSFATGTNPYHVTLADLDGDGKLDAAVSNYNGGSISVLRNTSTGTTISFAPKVDFTVGTNPDFIRSADIDDDGKLDLGVTNYGGNTISLFRNISNPGTLTTASFAPRVDIASLSFPAGLAFSDVDADGKIDMAVTNYINTSVSLYRNIGSVGTITTGTFEARVNFATQAGPGSVAIGDFDADGKPDLAVTNFNNNSISVLKNTATSGTFTASTLATQVNFSTGALGDNPRHVAISDVDGDAKPDIVVQNQIPAAISVFKNTSSAGVINTGSFATKVDYAAAGNPRVVTIGDLDGDGKPDLVSTANTAGVVSVLRNQVSSLPPPTITSFNPTFGAFDEDVVITGTNFSTTPANNVVRFNGLTAVVVSSTPTTITAKVPVGATDGAITVTVGCSTATSSSNFNVVCDVPAIQKAALMALYTATDGANWTSNTNWGVGNATSWVGVVTDLGCNVTELNLQFNNLVGSIPPEIGDLTELTTLRLSSNQLNGSLPDEITNLVNLEYLFLNNNDLSGALPATIGNMTSLKSIDTQVNEFSGPIPASLAACTDLRTLNLEGNQHTGSVPSFLGTDNINLQSINLGFNQFDGIIPSELGNLGNLSFLSLAENDLFSVIPSELGDLGQLTLLDLSRNFLSGTLPPELGNLTNLVSLQLWQNAIIGNVPATFNNLVNLQELNLNMNNLDGLPANWSALTQLRVLNLGHNWFNTSVPASIGALPSLEEVILSINSFTSIPLFTSPSITMLDVSSNYLDFGDLEPNIGVTGYAYSPQGRLPGGGRFTFTVGGTLTIPYSATGSANSYEWYNPDLIPGATLPTLTKTGMLASDDGFYTVRITSSIVTGLTLEGPEFIVVGAACGPGGPEGEIDASFDPSLDDPAFVSAVALQSTGKLIVSMSQTDIDGGTYNGDGVVRFNADGTFDPGFVNPFSGVYPGNHGLVIQPDDKILMIAGGNILRLNADGSEDTGFNEPGFYNASVWSIELQPDDKILFCVTEDGGTPFVGRLNPDGTNDASFTRFEFYGEEFTKILVQPDGMIVLGNGYGTVIRLTSTGDIDPLFLQGSGGYVTDMVLQPDGKIVVVGGFTQYHGIPCRGIVRLNTDGTVDQSFEAMGITNVIEGSGDFTSVVLQPDGKILLTGFFEQINGTNRLSLARLNDDGTIDCSFDPGAGLDVNAGYDMVQQPDGKILIVGDFPTYDGVTRNGFARINNGVASVLPPTITSFSPTSGAVGTLITITGTNFSTTPSSNLVFFGATRASVTVATATQLTVSVPTGATHQPITVSVNGLSAHAARPFIVTFAGGGAIDNCSFAPAFVLGTTAGFTRSTLADIDGDGKTDLLIPNTTADLFYIYRNTATPGSIAGSSFATPISVGAVETPLSIAVGDLDGDGKRDIAVINYNLQKLSIYKNQSVPGTISLAPKFDLTIPDFAHDVAIGDIDLDGNLDLAITTSLVGLTIYANLGTPGVIDATTFAAGVNFTTGPNPFPFVLGDIDGDGKLDAAVPNANAYTVSLLRNTSTPGTISFAPHLLLTTAPGSPPAGLGTVYTEFGDLDGDSKLDLTVTTNTVQVTSIFRNTSTPGTLSFDPRFDLANTGTSAIPTLSDLDGDGKIELIRDKGNFQIEIFKNVSTPGSINAASFNPPVVLSRSGSGFILAGDLDGDGRNDLLTSATNIQAFRSLIGTLSPPTISGFSPSAGAIGSSVTITGANFTSPFSTAVSFNGTTAVIIDLQPTSIIVSVPPGATTGLIQVTVGCNSVNSATNFSVCTTPSAPGVVPVSRCGSGTVVLGASGTSNGNYRWYTVSSGGTAIAGEVNDTYTTPALSTNTTYFAAINNGGCEGPRTSVTATILALPASPVVTGAQGCGPSASLTLFATGGSPGEYRWYTVAAGGTPIVGETNNTYVTPVLLTSTSYYVSIDDGTCESLRIPVLAEIRSCTPIIAEATASTPIGTPVTIDIGGLVTTISDPIDLASIKVITQPLSGATATVTNGMLEVNYMGVDFAGTDQLTIEACDLASHCAQQDVVIDVYGDITVFNAVSPNNDGANDAFIIQHIETLSSTQVNHVTILDRWGTVVFEVDNYDNQNRVFRGLSNDGNELPPGTYYYKLTFPNGGETRTGFISMRK